MSYFTFMACSSELPTGSFGSTPKAIYASYADYRQSTDYAPPTKDDLGTPLEEIIDLTTIEGCVIVFASMEDLQDVYVEPLDFRFATFVTDAITDNLSLPFRYSMGQGMPHSRKLLHYLRTFLQAGDIVEMYTRDVGDRRKMGKPPQKTYDLNADIDANALSFGRHQLLIFTAPDTPAQPGIARG